MRMCAGRIEIGVIQHGDRRFMINKDFWLSKVSDKLSLSIEASEAFIQSINDGTEPNEVIKKAARLYREGIREGKTGNPES